MDLFYKKFSQGSSAIIYKKNDIIFKKYYYYTEPRYLITEDLFDTLKEIDSPNLLKLIKLIKNHDIIEGYTYKYIPRDEINIVQEERYYTLDNVSDLLKLIEKFSYLRVLINDALSFNIITQKDRLVIIDPDSFNINYKKTYEEALIYNKKQLLEYIKSLYLNCFETKQREYYDTINKLFDFKIDQYTDLCHEMAKRLVFKKPIDAINKIKESI